jgi:protein disulfide-isomerase A1
VAKNQRVPFDQTKEITSKDIEKFVAGYLDGSPQISTNNDGPVIVVTHTYKDIVLDDEKDVIVEFYAPWVAYPFYTYLTPYLVYPLQRL